MDIRQFKIIVVKSTLEYLKIGGIEQAINLLTGTALVESRLFYLDQVEKGGDKKIGPAIGVFQMEMATHDDIWRNFLDYKKDLAFSIRALRSPVMPEVQQLATNLSYAAAMCRVHYLRKSEPLPAANDAEGMARYWKKHYNTYLGAGTIEKAIPVFKQAIAA